MILEWANIYFNLILRKNAVLQYETKLERKTLPMKAFLSSWEHSSSQQQFMSQEFFVKSQVHRNVSSSNSVLFRLLDGLVDEGYDGDVAVGNGLFSLLGIFGA